MRNGVENKIGARFTVIVGDDELASGKLQLKDMASGEQRQLERTELADAIRR